MFFQTEVLARTKWISSVFLTLVHILKTLYYWFACLGIKTVSLIIFPVWSLTPNLALTTLPIAPWGPLCLATLSPMLPPCTDTQNPSSGIASSGETRPHQNPHYRHQWSLAYLKPVVSKGAGPGTIFLDIRGSDQSWRSLFTHKCATMEEAPVLKSDSLSPASALARAKWPSASFVTSLSLNFLIHKMGISLPASQDCYKY